MNSMCNYESCKDAIQYKDLSYLLFVSLQVLELRCHYFHL